ncbi:MAG: type II secretion system F family protein [Xanthobacteraceae bacterium]|nr:type II secretion system F family protein [Xanthobacteraceae bacterium]QYK45217.1 MAG: type II secretion system F family protein [Xanthobacteraceae bacterium]
MQAFSDKLAALWSSPATVVSALIFFAATALALGIMSVIRNRAELKRRAAAIVVDIPGRQNDAANKRSLRFASITAAQKLIEYTTKHYAAADDGNMKVLRRRLIEAGILDPRAPGFFFIARTVLAIGFAAAAMPVVPNLLPDLTSSWFWMLVMCAGMMGYMTPSLYLGRRIATSQTEHRAGFPDFMDLLVVCADAGLSMEASLDRVGRELSDSYPSLSANVHMATLEIRAGRTLGEALEHLAERLGLEEARAFATLLQQSAELGSSLTDALRVYSDDMRHKRLSLAEEKAYSLPAKLSVPLVLCIFPVLVIVTMLPAYVRVKYGPF